MGSITKTFLVLCVVGVVGSLVYRASSTYSPALPKDMPPDARFLQTGYDLSQNERRGLWVACHTGEAGASQCRVTDTSGIVIFQGEFLAVKDARAYTGLTDDSRPAEGKLAWVSGPVEGVPVPVIPMSDGSFLVPRDDRGPLLDRWNQHPEEWQAVEAGTPRS